MKIKFISILLLSFCSYWSYGQIEEKTIEVITQNTQVQLILKQAEEEFTQTLITEILGEDNIEKMKTAIEKKILSKTKNFILLTKIIDKKEYKIEKDSQKEFIYSVSIKYSTKTLKDVLIREGIYYTDEGAHKILPLIAFIDEEEGYENSWWAQKTDNSDYSKNIQNFYSPLQRLFIKEGFYLLNPLFSQYSHHLPSKLSTQYLSVKKAQKIAQYFQAQFFIIGSIKIAPFSNNQYQSLWNLTLYSTPHLRKLDSYKFRVELPKKSWPLLHQHSNYWANNFILQIKNVYDTGTLSTQLFTIEISGDLTYLERNRIREALIKDIPNIQSLTMHYISAQKERYKADIKGTDQEVLSKLKNWKFLDFKLSSYLKSKNYIIIRVKKS